jgi:HSP20 family molecular chaperone IbpA
MAHDPTDWMWRKATHLLERADAIARRSVPRPAGPPAWSPAADVFESKERITIVVALPGVEPERLEVALERAALVVRGERRLPSVCQVGEVRRLEIPYGRFERELSLPYGRYELLRNELERGCLILELGKVE